MRGFGEEPTGTEILERLRSLFCYNSWARLFFVKVVTSGSDCFMWPLGTVD